jgi:hypothetical protein
MSALRTQHSALRAQVICPMPTPGAAYVPMRWDARRLLYCAGGLSSLHAALARAPTSAGNLHMNNLEAVLPRIDCVDPFREAFAFRHDPGDFCAYANGKSFGRLSVALLRPAGPHNFGAPETHKLKPSTAVVLHFESASFDAWRRKYADLARRHAGNDRVRQQAPSEFYADSMDAMSRLLAAEASGEPSTISSAMAASRQLYSRWKLPHRALPAPPAGPPQRLVAERVTLIDVFAQPHVSPLPGRRGTDERRAVGLAGAGAGVAANGADVTLPQMDVEGLLRLAGLHATHADAVRALGAEPSHLLHSRKEEFDALVKSAGLPLGPRLKLRTALAQLRSAPAP